MQHAKACAVVRVAKTTAESRAGSNDREKSEGKKKRKEKERSGKDF